MFEPLLKTGQQTLKNKKSSGAVHRHTKDQFIYAIIIIMSVAFLCSVYACSRQQPSSIEELVKETHPSNLKILLVGIDGATFSVIKPMIKEGRLPQLKKLMDGGVQGIRKSQEPTISPAIWTSIVTGRDHKDHGIDFFVVSDPELPNKKPRLMNSGHRKTLAIWNILGPFAKLSGFIRWWASWPAEKVYEWIISSYLAHDNFLKWLPEGKIRHYLAYPAALTNELQPFMVNPMDPPLEKMSALVEFTQEELEQVKAARKELIGNGLSVHKFAYCLHEWDFLFQRDAKGRVLTEITEPAFLEKHPVKHIRSYEGLIKRAKPSVHKDIEPENLDMLRALGYIK
jgi:hypothetical protein